MLGERELGVEPTHVFVGPRRLASSSTSVPERTADEWIKGPPVAAPRRRRRDSRSATGSAGGPRGAGRVPRGPCPGEPLRGGAARAGRRDRPRARSSGSRCAGTTAATGSPGRCAGVCAKLDEETCRRLRDDASATASRTARSRSRRAQEYADRRCVRPRSSPMQRSGGARSSTRSTRSASGATRCGVLDEVVYLVEQAVVLEGSVRRAVPPAARARDRDGDAVAPAVLPAWGKQVRLRCQRGRPGPSFEPGTRTCSRGGSRTRASRSSATSSVGHRRARRAARRDHVLRGRRHVRRQDGPARAGARRASSAAARRRSRRRGSRRPTRPRSSCASFRSWRATSAPSTRGSRATRRPSARRSRSSTCRTRREAPLPETEAGPRARCRRQDRHARPSRSRSASGPRAPATRTGSAGRRSASAGLRSRAA